MNCTAQCLHTVTEDNQTAAHCLCENTSLMKILEGSMMAEQSNSDMLLTKVLSAGNVQTVILCIYKWKMVIVQFAASLVLVSSTKLQLTADTN